MGQAVKEAGATLLNRLVLLRHIEALGLARPEVVTGGWGSKGYQELREFAPALLGDDTEGYGVLLQMVFDELEDIRKARAQASGKDKAEKRFAEAQKWLEELSDFIDKVTELAECGPHPPDPKTPQRETDARFTMDLDDGVMVNSAALWPVLEPQWKDPKKWWKELASAEGRKDYDWAQLAARYFPARVRANCVRIPTHSITRSGNIRS